MILKSLLLQGFKSFPEKTEIRFHEGMTAIVGPNGSGKSNISDAIRWVLGEQSTKSLRGGKMEDVIFSGTTRRRPTGFAEVSLILDNSTHVFQSDFTDIMVTRRYYRSGESEYYLNKKHCRLRDIHELFMDTGLGRDGYSIIGQGKIDEILSQKSEDRREVFEEAAGITKFRYRKEEAERKLARAEDNLLRIRDIYTELQRQIGPLEKQAEKAKQYLILRDELRVLEVSLWLLELTDIKQDAEKTAQSLDICTQDLTNTQAQQQALYAKSEQLLADMQMLDRETDALRREMRALEQQAAAESSRAQVAQATMLHNAETIARMQAENTQRETQAVSLATQIAGKQEGLGAGDAQKAILEAQSAVLGETFRALLEKREQETRALQTSQQTLAALGDKLHALALTRTEAQTHMEAVAKRGEDLTSDEGQARAQLQAETEKQEGMARAQADCAAACETLRAQLDAAREAQTAVAARLQEAQRAQDAAQHRLVDTQNRMRMLADMQKDYEGFSRSVKITMNRAERGQQSGVHGPVSALIQTENKFITAIDVALGASASSIVVDGTRDAKACIAHLKQCDGGRATFLPLDTIKPASLRESGLEKLPNCYGTADKLTNCKDTYRPIVQNLLARTVIVDTMDDGLRIAKQYGHRFRIVTLDGQVLQVGGAMTGGSLSRGTGALARAAKLQELEKQMAQAQKALEQAQQALLRESEAQAAGQQALDALEAELQGETQRAAALQAAASQHALYLNALREQSSGMLDAASAQEALARGYAEQVQQCQTQEATLAQEKETLEQTIKKQEEASAALQAEMEMLQAQRQTMQTELARLQAEHGAAVAAIEDLQTLEAEMRNGIAAANMEMERLSAENERLTAEQLQTQASSQQAQGAVEKLGQDIAANVAKRQQIEGERTQADKLAQSQTERILALQREQSRLENAFSKLETRETQILDKMWERYELTPSPAGELAVLIENRSDATARADTLRGQMRALGNVNLGAVEEYTEALERYTFMGQQKEDLEKSQRELRHIIDKLTDGMREVFATEFAKLNGYFGETFREMFGGGHAQLQLADTSDILNCGIDIIVSPPGKSVKTITLLSGGERAFVAIALYFAILKLRPTPFCVLDEIEAALDDVNVVRYAQYIRRLTGGTQFIVITHRRGTMEEADMLYGVTMQEQGISKLLMLNLVEAEKQIEKHL